MRILHCNPVKQFRAALPTHIRLVIGLGKQMLLPGVAINPLMVVEANHASRRHQFPLLSRVLPQGRYRVFVAAKSASSFILFVRKFNLVLGRAPSFVREPKNHAMLFVVQHRHLLQNQHQHRFRFLLRGHPPRQRRRLLFLLVLMFRLPWPEEVA